MIENKLNCCVVRDLLPAYIEDLTESETTALVKEHLEKCPSCKAVENDMRTSVPIEKAPKRALHVLKRVKRTRLIAAILATVVALGCMWWLYDQEFHYANTAAGRLAAVEDYIPQPENSTMTHGVKAGTPLRAVSWAEQNRHLFIFYTADNEENVWGIIHLVRGINGKYRTIEATYSPSQYTGGIYGESLTPKGTDWRLFMLAGYNCRDIYTAEIQYSANDYNGVDRYPITKTYEVKEADFLWIMDQEELMQELEVNGESIVRLMIDEIRLLDKNGNDVTSQYKDDSENASWGGGIGTAELFLVYVYMGIVALLGVVFIRYFLRRD
jgi:hypothetical protein